MQENFPLSSEDFVAHIQKKSHKEKEIERQQMRQNESECNYVTATSRISVNESNSVSVNSGQTSSSASVVSNSDTKEASKPNCVDIPSSTIVRSKLKDTIEIEQVFEAITAEIVYTTSRTVSRIKNEAQIVALLTHYLNKFNPMLELRTFGSATYGFGGANTNFNILVDAGRNYDFNSLTFLQNNNIVYMYLRCVSSEPD